MGDKDLLGTGAHRNLLDPCIYMWYEGDELIGLLILHVDDMRCSGNLKWETTVFKKIKELYHFG